MLKYFFQMFILVCWDCIIGGIFLNYDCLHFCFINKLRVIFKNLIFKVKFLFRTQYFILEISVKMSSFIQINIEYKYKKQKSLNSTYHFRYFITSVNNIPCLKHYNWNKQSRWKNQIYVWKRSNYIIHLF